MLVAIGSATVPQPAHAVSPAAAAGIGLGAFALGSVLANPYYHSYYYPYGYYYPPVPAYYPPAPYYPSHSCYRDYYTC